MKTLTIGIIVLAAGIAGAQSARVQSGPGSRHGTKGRRVTLLPTARVESDIAPVKGPERVPDASRLAYRAAMSNVLDAAGCGTAGPVRFMDSKQRQLLADALNVVAEEMRNNQSSLRRLPQPDRGE